MEQYDGQSSPPSVSPSVIENSATQNAPMGTINDFALRVPPPTQRVGGGTLAHRE